MGKEAFKQTAGVCRHGNPISCPECAREALETKLAERAKMQKQERVSGEVDDFGDDLIVGYAMGKDMGKRPGETPGEDMFLADKETGLTGVFDGLGGEGAGDKAAATAAERMPDLYKDVRERTADMFGNKLLSEKMKKELFESQASLEHPTLRQAATGHLEKMWSGLPDEVRQEMIVLFKTARALSEEVAATKGYSTMTVGKSVLSPDGKMYEVAANIGDSGGLKIREDGTAVEITKEDSSLDEAIAAGLLTPEEAKNPKHEVKASNGEPIIDPRTNKPVTVSLLRRGMYQALGKKNIVPRITVTLVRPGEKIVYLTDGARDEIVDADGNFDAAAAAKLTKPEVSTVENAKRLLEAAAKGPKKDEITVLVKERTHAIESVSDDDEIELSESDIIEAA